MVKLSQQGGTPLVFCNWWLMPFFLKTSQIRRDLIWVTLMVSEVLPEFSGIFLVNPCATTIYNEMI